MKHFMLSSALMLASTFAMAQTNSTESFGPTAGSISTEVEFNPFANNRNTLDLDGIKVRYYLDKESALRLSLDLGLSSNKDYAAAEKDDFEKDNFEKTRSFSWALGVGYEKSHTVAPRLEVFYGAEVGINRYSRKETSSTEEYENTKKTSTFGYYAAALTGFDYYIYRNLYLGTELGFRLSHSKKGLTKTEVDGEETTTKDPDSSTNLGFFIEPSIRLGWTF